MKPVLLGVLLASSASAAVPAPPSESKGLRFERRSDCQSPATFERLLFAGADAWGAAEGDAQRSVDLLAAAVQCRAFAAGSEKGCDALGDVPRFPAGKSLAADCRVEHQLLAFYDAMRARDGARARAACARWHELGRAPAFKGLDAAAVCKRAVELLLEDQGTACGRLGADLAGTVKDARQREGVALLCRAVWTPGEAACAQKGLPLDKKACSAYGRISVALRAKDAKGCPASDRWGGLCRALAAKDPLTACEAVRADWQKLVCAAHFAAGQGGEEP